jgi:hypothetical protein
VLDVDAHIMMPLHEGNVAVFGKYRVCCIGECVPGLSGRRPTDVRGCGRLSALVRKECADLPRASPLRNR